jgi:HK97 family phage prohead protease
MLLTYKSIPFQLKEVVDITGGGWEIAGYASTFGGEPDEYGDVIVKGAFLESLTRRSPKHLYEHGEPIGKTLEIHEDDKGLVGRWSIVDTTAGTDAYKLAKAGVLDSMSIGYMPVDFEYREDGVRLLKKIDLFEVSSVAIPANRHAVITDVKTWRERPFDLHSDDVRVAVARWLERVKSGSDLRLKEGRAMSAGRRERMAAVSGSLKDACTEIDAMLGETAPQKSAPAERVHIGLETRRRRLAGHGIDLGVAAS